MSKHTPGPWGFWSGYNHLDKIEAQITAEGGDIVIASYNHLIEQGEDNARLMTAAPDLLKALEEMIDNEEQIEFESWLSDFSPSGDSESVHSQWLASSGFEDFCEAVKLQLEAIAKAKGE